MNIVLSAATGKITAHEQTAEERADADARALAHAKKINSIRERRESAAGRMSLLRGKRVENLTETEREALLIELAERIGLIDEKGVIV